MRFGKVTIENEKDPLRRAVWADRLGYAVE
jgi:hypothetical protein